MMVFFAFKSRSLCYNLFFYLPSMTMESSDAEPTLPCPSLFLQEDVVTATCFIYLAIFVGELSDTILRGDSSDDRSRVVNLVGLVNTCFMSNSLCDETCPSLLVPSLPSYLYYCQEKFSVDPHSLNGTNSNSASSL